MRVRLPPRPFRDSEVVDVKQIVVSTDPMEGAIIAQTTNSDRDLDPRLPPFGPVKLEASLLRAMPSRSSIMTLARAFAFARWGKCRDRGPAKSNRGKDNRRPGQIDGVPEGIRTPDLRFRKPLLYPAELPGRTRNRVA